MSNTALSAQGTTLQIQIVGGSAKTVSAVAVGFPTIMTSAAHGFSNGDVVTFAAFAGADAAALNGKTISIGNVTANTFAVDINTIGLTITAGSATATPGNWATIGNMKTVSGFDGKPSEIDVTNLSSTAKEFVTGLIDFGNLQIEVDQDNADQGQLKVNVAFQGSLVKNYKLTLPNTNSATFAAFVTQFTTSLGVDQVVKRQIGLRITGPVTWA
jgi:hypothetical protein